MPEKEEIFAKMRQGRFKENNGRVLRTINILRNRYVRLTDCQYALDDITDADFLDCINFLFRAGYIDLRTCSGHKAANIADFEYDDLEAAVSEKGIRLLGGEITDKMIEN